MAPSRTYGSSSRPARSISAPYNTARPQASRSNRSQASTSQGGAVASSSRAITRLQSPAPTTPELTNDSENDSDEELPGIETFFSTYKPKKQSSKNDNLSLSSRNRTSDTLLTSNKADREEASINNIKASRAATSDISRSKTTSNVSRSKASGASSTLVSNVIDIDDSSDEENSKAAINSNGIKPTLPKSAFSKSKQASSINSFSNKSSSTGSDNANNKTNKSDKPSVAAKRVKQTRNIESSEDEAVPASTSRLQAHTSSKLEQDEDEDEKIRVPARRARKQARITASSDEEDDQEVAAKYTEDDEESDALNAIIDDLLLEEEEEVDIEQNDLTEQAPPATTTQNKEQKKTEEHAAVLKGWKDEFKRREATRSQPLPVNVGPTEAKGMSQEEASALVTEAQKRNNVAKVFAFNEVGNPTCFVVEWDPKTYSKDPFHVNKLLDDLSKQEGFPKRLALEIGQKPEVRPIDRMKFCPVSQSLPAADSNKHADSWEGWDKVGLSAPL